MTTLAVLRLASRKATPLKPISLRIPAHLWKKCELAGAAIGLDRSTFVRNTLEHATRNAQPPVDAKSREILASEEEWSAWLAAAKRLDRPLPELMPELMNRLSARQR
jgi:hypothetical protein